MRANARIVSLGAITKEFINTKQISKKWTPASQALAYIFFWSCGLPKAEYIFDRSMKIWSFLSVRGFEAVAGFQLKIFRLLSRKLFFKGKALPELGQN